jgi:hypothetical protein
MKDPKHTWEQENPFDTRDPAFRQVIGEQISGPERLDMAGMTAREEEEFTLLYGPRKERKALKRRRKALEKAAKENK